MSNRWTAEEIQRRFKDYAGDADPDDPRERKRLRILAAATRHFIRHGYRKASIDEIAREAGVAKGTVYLYFKTKGELILHAIIEEKRRYLATVLPLFAEAMSPRDRLFRMIQGTLVLATQMPLVARLLGGDHEIMAALDDMPADVMKQSEVDRSDIMGEIVRAVAPELGPDLVEEYGKVLSGLQFFSGLLTDPHVRRGLSIERYAELLAGLITDGLAGPPGDPPAKEKVKKGKRR